jgi:hypothetical protein
MDITITRNTLTDGSYVYGLVLWGSASGDGTITLPAIGDLDQTIATANNLRAIIEHGITETATLKSTPQDPHPS